MFHINVLTAKSYLKLGARNLEHGELTKAQELLEKALEINPDSPETIIKENLSTDRVLVYGNGVCQTVASFCGGGASSALEQVVSGNTVADTIVTSDTAHHVVKELVERNIKLIIIPHYSAEDYGFRKFYASVKNDLEGTTQAFYYQDKRFM